METLQSFRERVRKMVGIDLEDIPRRVGYPKRLFALAARSNLVLTVNEHWSAPVDSDEDLRGNHPEAFILWEIPQQ